MQAELTQNGIPRVEVWRKGIETERFHPSFLSTEMRLTISDGNPEDFDGLRGTVGGGKTAQGSQRYFGTNAVGAIVHCWYWTLKIIIGTTF
jgi:hypothetical protein